MNKTFEERLISAYENHKNLSNITFSYGTAGFRYKADVLDSVFFVVGILATIRANYTKKTCGVMITASHNPFEDNGVKIIDHDGEMLEISWEKYAEWLANAKDSKTLVDKVNQILIETKTDMKDGASVYIARDTRPSSPSLSKSVIDGCNVFNAKVKDFGLLSTPQLHYMVLYDNENQKESKDETPYFEQLSSAYAIVLSGDEKEFQISKRKRVVDCAYGVGGIVLKKLAKYINFEFKLLNDPEEKEAKPEFLNDECGSEYVQKSQKLPRNYESMKDEAVSKLTRLLTRQQVEDGFCIASVDGDVDRLVYSFVDGEGKYNLIDGDKMTALIAMFIMEQMTILGIENELNLGAVQTAYANGSSTAFLKKVLGDDRLAIAKTGVKYVAEKAATFDIGIYFEANGHGTVLFKPKAIELFKKTLSSLDKEKNPKEYKACIRLLYLPKLINQAVGDALSDLLALECILAIKNMKISDWLGLYKDIPSIQLKLQVKDRTKIKCSEDETRVIEPAEIQNQLDALMKKYKLGRTFVRPSGTEDVVRVYAEAETSEMAKSLANDVIQVVKNSNL